VLRTLGSRCRRFFSGFVVAGFIITGPSSHRGSFSLGRVRALGLARSRVSSHHSVAVDGDFIIAISGIFDLQAYRDKRRGYLFRRDADGCTYVRTLFSDINASQQIPVPVSVAMGGGTAAINYAPLYETVTQLNVFQRSGTDYDRREPRPRYRLFITIEEGGASS
jgi:hypothetical protein